MKKGDLLARLSSRETEAKLRQARAYAAAAANRPAELERATWLDAVRGWLGDGGAA